MIGLVQAHAIDEKFALQTLIMAEKQNLSNLEKEQMLLLLGLRRLGMFGNLKL